MATLTKPQHRLVTVSSLLGIVQGLAWFVMSLICIILYLGSVDSGITLPPTEYYKDYLEWAMFIYILWGNSTDSGIITPHSFTIFMWIYLIASLMWTVVSALQLRTINKAHANPLNLMKCWGVLTCVISLIDFLLVVLLGAEHSENCLTSATNDYELLLGALCTNVLITVLVIAARGFTLWIVNVIFIYITYRIVRTVHAGNNFDRRLLKAVDQRIPRASLYDRTSTNPRSNPPTPAGPQSGNMYPHQASTLPSNNSSVWSNQNQPTSAGPQSGNMWPHQASTLPSNNSSIWPNRNGPLTNDNTGDLWNQNSRPMSHDPRTPGSYPTQQQQPYAKY